MKARYSVRTRYFGRDVVMSRHRTIRRALISAEDTAGWIVCLRCGATTSPDTHPTWHTGGPSYDVSIGPCTDRHP